MKNLRNLLKTLLIVTLVTFASCKKDAKEEVTPEPITSEELMKYHIVITLKNSVNKMGLFYFTKEGTQVKATLDGVNTRRIQVINVQDNSFSFDRNGDGTVVYTFKLERDGKGDVSILSSDLKTTPGGAYINTAFIYNVSAAGQFKNRTFLGEDNSLTFTANTWTASSMPNAVGSFYEIAPGAWKGALMGAEFMGITFLGDDKSTAMAVERAGAPELYFLSLP